jgi:hypothetical protein
MRDKFGPFSRLQQGGNGGVDGGAPDAHIIAGAVGIGGGEPQ